MAGRSQASKNAKSVAKGLIGRKISIIIISVEIRWFTAMPHSRRISWNAALRDIRSDRVRVTPGVISARSLIQAFVHIRRIHLVSQTGTFDRMTIMGLAVEAAKAHRRRTGATWSVSMSVGLSAAWQAARAARLAFATKRLEPVESDRNIVRRLDPQLHKFALECGDAPHSAAAPTSPPTLSPYTQVAGGLISAEEGPALARA